jgi:hypothetical protein
MKKWRENINKFVLLQSYFIRGKKTPINFEDFSVRVSHSHLKKKYISIKK